MDADENADVNMEDVVDAQVDDAARNFPTPAELLQYQNEIDTIVRNNPAHTVSPAILRRMVQLLKLRWIPPRAIQRDTEPHDLAYLYYNVTFASRPAAARFNKSVWDYRSPIIRTLGWLNSRAVSQNDMDLAPLRETLTICFSCVDSYYYTLAGEFNVASCSTATAPIPAASWYGSGNAVLDYNFDVKKCKLTPFQQLLIAIMLRIQAMGLRRGISSEDRTLYTPILVDGLVDARGEPVESHAWKPHMTFEEFVMNECRFSSGQSWVLYTSMGARPNQIADYLAISCDFEFMPRVIADRHTFAFSNGIFIANSGKYGRFEPYLVENNQLNTRISSDVVAIKYFALPFLYDEYISYADPYNIPVDGIDHILADQHLDDEGPVDAYINSVLGPRPVSFFMWVAIGRMMYDLHEEDQWEIFNMIAGRGGTGKSSILNGVQAIYPKGEVAILSSNCEPNFPLQTLYSKLCMICYEVRDHFNLDQAIFQSCLSGEDVVIARKHLQAVVIQWKQPMMFSGNMVAFWNDNNGNMTRRTVLFRFEKRVKQMLADMTLLIRQHMPEMIFRANACYRRACELMNGQTNIQDSPYFPTVLRKNLEQFSAELNPVTAFLTSSEVRLHAKDFVLLKTLQTRYSEFVRGMGVSSSPPALTKMKITLADFGVSVSRVARRINNNSVPQDWCFGVTVFNVRSGEGSDGNRPADGQLFHMVGNAAIGPVGGPVRR